MRDQSSYLVHPICTASDAQKTFPHGEILFGPISSTPLPRLLSVFRSPSPPPHHHHIFSLAPLPSPSSATPPPPSLPSSPLSVSSLFLSTSSLRYQRLSVLVSSPPPSTGPLQPLIYRAPFGQTDRTDGLRSTYLAEQRAFVRSNRTEERPSVRRQPPFGQTDGLRLAYLAKRRAFVRPNRMEQRAYVRSYLPNGVERKAGAGEGGAGLME